MIRQQSLNVHRQTPTHQLGSSECSKTKTTHSTQRQRKACTAIRRGDGRVPCRVPMCYPATHDALCLLGLPDRHTVLCHYPKSCPAKGGKDTHTPKHNSTKRKRSKVCCVFSTHLLYDAEEADCQLKGECSLFCLMLQWVLFWNLARSPRYYI